MTPKERATEFVTQETSFHLGFLPTEQSHPQTITLEADFKRSIIDGIKTLQRADEDIVGKSQEIFASPQYSLLVQAMRQVLNAPEGRIIFSGCGATGRLSILLESMWREYAPTQFLADKCASIMTGGDFAMIKSVESFEDYSSVGKRQVAELAVNSYDLFIAITEGGETSSVLGSLEEAANQGAKCFLIFSNPAPLLRKHIKRSRDAIEDLRVSILDLYTGPMALAGSTRMQATTCEQLILSHALEDAISAPSTFTFPSLLKWLKSDEIRKIIADEIALEEETYSNSGLITYIPKSYVLDIFTDTTERSPTFTLPPFKSSADITSQEPWALVKCPTITTKELWQKLLRRPLRCLNWEDYSQMKIHPDIIQNPPHITEHDLLSYHIGSEENSARYQNPNSKAIHIFPFESTTTIEQTPFSSHFAHQHTLTIPANIPESPLHIWRHLAVKLIFNTISTGTMVRLGRVTGNWMSYVNVTNKKLIDRAIRIVSDQAKIPYEEAAIRIFSAIEERENNPGCSKAPVQIALQQ